jgi:hypothetical protein
MNALTLEDTNAMTRMAADARCYDDPLDDDRLEDAVVSTTMRALTRLALVACETGARFQREGVGHDPMGWMLAPRLLFDGAAPLEACLERDNCLRAVLLHGLSIGLDASTAQIDALLADDPLDGGEPGSWSGGSGGSMFQGGPGKRRSRLYSAIIVIARGGELLHAFHASIAPSAAVIRERIRARLGAAAAAQADIRIGFDPECPGTVGMVPPAVMDTLIAAGRRSRSSAMDGLDITVEQRLPS